MLKHPSPAIPNRSQIIGVPYVGTDRNSFIPRPFGHIRSISSTDRQSQCTKNRYESVRGQQAFLAYRDREAAQTYVEWHDCPWPNDRSRTINIRFANEDLDLDRVPAVDKSENW